MAGSLQIHRAKLNRPRGLQELMRINSPLEERTSSRQPSGKRLQNLHGKKIRKVFNLLLRKYSVNDVKPHQPDVVLLGGEGNNSLENLA